MTWAGLPATVVSASTSFVTTEPAAIIARAPIRTPRMTNDPAPIQASSSILTGWSSRSISLGWP